MLPAHALLAYAGMVGGTAVALGYTVFRNDAGGVGVMKPKPTAEYNVEVTFVVGTVTVAVYGSLESAYQPRELGPVDSGQERGASKTRGGIEGRALRLV